METTDEPCVICQEKVTDPYTVQCGSKTPHIVCTPCDLKWRLTMTQTPEGRFITCPMCRAVEKDTSTRSAASLQAELTHVYFELATKTGKSSVTQAVRDYIHLLETVAAVPHIQLSGLMVEPPSYTVPVVPISRRARNQIEMEARVVRAVTARQTEANQRAMRQAQEAQRRAAARQARREHAEAARLADLTAAVWCESGNIALGLCATSRKTNRRCSVAGCPQRVCFRCDKCTTH